MKKLTTIYFILPVLILILFSGCAKKEITTTPGKTSNPNPETTSTTTEENVPTWPKQVYTEDDYAGWKTYTNKKLGYRIKYPADWTINACDEGCTSKEVIINPPNAEMFTSYISISLESRDIDVVRSVYLNPDYYGGCPYNEESIIFSFKPAHHFYNGDLKEIENVLVYLDKKSFSITTQKVSNKKVLQALASFEFITEKNYEVYKQKFTDPELSLSFSYPDSCSIKTSKENSLLDKGRIKKITVLCDRDIPISFKYMSEDYKEGNGEGCCFYYSDKPLNVNLDSSTIKNKLKEFKPTDIRIISIDNTKAIQFISYKNYIDTWKVKEIIIPQKGGEYSNLLISSPDINDIESFVIYNNIYKSIKLN